jgi:hypothetical protein
VIRGRLIALALLAALFQEPVGAASDQERQVSRLADEAAVVAEAHGALLETDPRAMVGLEVRGLSLPSLFGARARGNDALAETSLFAALASIVARDLKELDARPTIGDDPAPNRPFRLRWLSDARARFELVGAVNRPDRGFVEGPGSPSACGEARLVYRLVLEPARRPPTPLPMTVSVVFPQPAQPGAAPEAACAAIARRWRGLPREGAARLDALAALYRSLPPFTKVETNLQSLHGPALRAGEDDHAEYLLRTLGRRGDTLVPEPLLDTPRGDLDAGEQAALASWIRAHFDAIDRGTAVIPPRFLATRAVSVAPRGLARVANRPFARMFGDGSAAFGALPYEAGRLVRSPRGLVRRLDQATCSGCHESRAIAGFHLLGEARDPEARFNALANGRSNHLAAELAWRERVLLAAAEGGDGATEPRPFADRGSGGYGAHCAIDADPTFAAWRCDAGLACHDLTGDEVGVCAPADANHEGDACEAARVVPASPPDAPDGDTIVAAAKEACLFGGTRSGADACSPNHYGFPGGMCSEACTTLGRAGESVVCADLPASGYESDCFPLAVPIEQCLATHLARRRVRACDAEHPCRDDFGCARVPGLGPREGACVPPYFVFQARVDGPLLDR